MRSNAISALEELQGENAAPSIIPLLNDATGRVRLQAINSILRLQEKVLIPRLVSLLHDNDDQVRIRAMELLGQLQEENALIPKKEAISNVLPFLQDDNESIRYTAVTTLKALQAKEAIPSIIPLLRDTDSSVRNKASNPNASLFFKRS